MLITAIGFQMFKACPVRVRYLGIFQMQQFFYLCFLKVIMKFGGKAYYTGLFLFACAVSLLYSSSILAKPKEKTRILIILDCSGSMRAKWGKGDRMEAAKNILIHLVDSMKRVPDVELALRCYGHRHTVIEHDCKDTKLEVPFANNNADNIISFVRNLHGMGWTPIAYSLEESANDFPDTKARNVIMLITDGLEECGGDPCSASKGLMDKKIALEPYIIGIGLSEKMMKAFDCIGRNYSPKTEKDLGKVVSGVISEALDNTTIQVNLLDQKKTPKVTNLPLSFRSIPTGKSVLNVMHTLDEAGKPDTFSIDPNYTYTLNVFSVPPVQKKKVSIQTAHHNIVTLNVPLGNLYLSSSSSEYRYIPCLVRTAGNTDIVNVQDMNSGQQYLAGNYDLDVLTMPRISVKSTDVLPSETNKISVPDPGKIELIYKSNEVIGSMYVLRNQKQEWLFDFKGSFGGKKDVYLLQPGKYIAVYRPVKSTSMLDTKTQNFIISSGGTTQVTTD
jgi:Ca-activated chloride channel family protein